MDTATLANIEGMDWSNLSALGTLMALVLWFATKGLPSIMSKWETQAQVARNDFKEAVSDLVEDSRQQRQEFREELKLHREQSSRLAISGHETVKGLTVEVSNLREALRQEEADS